MRFVDPTGHVAAEGTGGYFGGSYEELMLYWSDKAVAYADAHRLDSIDAVDVVVPVEHRAEVKSIVGFNGAVKANYQAGDMPGLGLGASVGAGVGVAGIIRNTGSIAAKVESNAMAQLMKMEHASGSHYFARHGAQTTLSQQYTRATTGLTPEGIAGGRVDSSRFLTHQNQLTAVQRAETIFKQTGKTSFDFDMGKIIGEGYLRGEVMLSIRLKFRQYIEMENC